MELKVHDLIRMSSPGELLSECLLPEWVHNSLNRTPWVVVRRDASEDGLISVGVRGEYRNQRFAALLPTHCVKELVTPEQLVVDAVWRMHRFEENSELNVQLEKVSAYYNQAGLIWGLGGSVGFELVSGARTVHISSDVDLVLYALDPVDRKTAADWHAYNRQLSIRVDALLETPAGACSLQEYVRSDTHILLRTKNGPMLVKSPWTLNL
ncbi:MAG: malonate decarboxylase holo-ACP synthase [Paenibacillaceae bacterium]